MFTFAALTNPKINVIMKKILLTALFAVFAFTASAQVYVGGSAQFWRNFDANKTQVTVAPEVGYVLSSDWALGISLEYSYLYRGETAVTYSNKVNAFGVAPYARYTLANFGNVNLFVDGGFGFMALSSKSNGDTVNGSAWQVGLKPGVAVNLTKNLSFVAHVGFVGYTDCNNKYKQLGYDNPFGENGFGCRVDGSNLRFGLYYNF